MRNLILTMIVGLFTFVAPKNTFAQKNQDFEKVNIRVQKMTCDGDMPTIKAELLKKEGIMDVTFTRRQRETSVFTIKYFKGVVSKSSIEKHIENTPGCDDKSQKPYRVVNEKTQK
ncbi:heavy-metal-associated domain-containing protein [Sphingobacterium faecium]|uniref:heavy-metal-associated domain-containing protein n=1 Tax=Sphingobacterium faecium TaxID=34087 RepID=UPI002479D7FE|nr:heavy metal-associated domain-containing protein [Sphingobacterium faecium]WGQ12816.1 heavy metal-associated domain-containing protein [Sphingobacterium faecium]